MLCRLKAVNCRSTPFVCEQRSDVKVVLEKGLWSLEQRLAVHCEQNTCPSSDEVGVSTTAFSEQTSTIS